MSGPAAGRLTAELRRPAAAAAGAREDRRPAPPAIRACRPAALLVRVVALSRARGGGAAQGADSTCTP
jgi:hypothetical protein